MDGCTLRLLGAYLCIRLGVLIAKSRASNVLEGTSAPTPRSRSRVLVAALAALASSGATAETSEPRVPSDAQRVEIRGSTLVDDRMDANTPKIVLSREDINRFGDTNLLDVLQRVPGITIAGGGSQGREVRLRGLGGGYTQILIDGQPVPRGFSLEALAPDLIERIEVIRSGTVDMSAQAIAGSINIILRRAPPSTQGSAKLGAGAAQGSPYGQLSGQYGWREGNLSYSGTANVKLERNRWPSTTELSVLDSAGQVVSQQSSVTEITTKRQTVGLLPRATWRSQDQASFTFDSLLQAEQFVVDSKQTWAGSIGALTFYPLNLTWIRRDTTEARVSGNFKTPVGADGRLDFKTVAAFFRRTADTQVRSRDVQGLAAISRDVVAWVNDDSLTMSGSYAVPVKVIHTAKVGWDGQQTRRRESRVQREASETGVPTLDLDEQYTSNIRRLALFAQDEWSLDSGLAGYLGLRWERLQTRTEGNVLPVTTTTSSVVSPMLQVLWKIPDTKSDQVRLNLSRSYKTPTARELIPRRWVVTDNSATSPNFQGNPDLRPELAWGLDVGYERYGEAEGFFGMSAYMRRIQDVVRDRIFNDNGTWVVTPANSGDARVVGAELEAKGRIANPSAEAPPISYRLGITRNWSRVDAVPPPNNRLQEQPLFTATLGIDYDLPGKTSTIGGSITRERFGFTRISSSQSTSRDSRTMLDLYGALRMRREVTLRVTITNLLNSDDIVRSGYADAIFTQNQKVSSRTFRGLRLLLELEL